MARRRAPSETPVLPAPTPDFAALDAGADAESRLPSARAELAALREEKAAVIKSYDERIAQKDREVSSLGSRIMLGAQARQRILAGAPESHAAAVGAARESLRRAKDACDKHAFARNEARAELNRAVGDRAYTEPAPGKRLNRTQEELLDRAARAREAIDTLDRKIDEAAADLTVAQEALAAAEAAALAAAREAASATATAA